MKKQVRLIFKLSVILLLFTLRADAGMLQMGGGTPAAGASCTTSNDGRLSAALTGEAEGSIPNFVGTYFTIGDAGGWTITGYNVPVCRTGASTNTFTIEIWKGDTTDPNAIGTSPIITGSTVTTVLNDVVKECGGVQAQFFALSSPIDLAAGTYWLIISDTSGNNVHVAIGSEASYRHCESADAGANWTCYANYRTDFEIYGCVK